MIPEEPEKFKYTYGWLGKLPTHFLERADLPVLPV